MALTATATKAVRLNVSKRLGMVDPFVISLPPCKSNLFLEVQKHESIESSFKSLVSALQQNTTGRVIVYCNTITDCCIVRDHLNKKLGVNHLVPPDAENLSPHRVVDVYVSITDELVKKTIIESFTQPISILKVN